MKSKKKIDKYSSVSFLFAIGSVVLYGMLSDVKMLPYSTQFKTFAFLSLVALLLLIVGIFHSIIKQNYNIFNILFSLLSSALIFFTFYISYQTIVNYITPSESDVARIQRFNKIKLLNVSEINKISVWRHLQPPDFKDIDPKTVKEGKVFVKDVKKKEIISDFIDILKNCSFEKWPRYKSRDESFYIAIDSKDNSLIEFRVSHIKDTENTYEIFSYNSAAPSYKRSHGAAYSDEMHKWIELIN